ncbi:UNVERIFIED_CONTAM: hypothetical protein K2H54_074628 [Gekko kuhli]
MYSHTAYTPSPRKKSLTAMKAATLGIAIQQCWRPALSPNDQFQSALQFYVLLSWAGVEREATVCLEISTLRVHPQEDMPQLLVSFHVTQPRDTSIPASNGH